MPRTSSWFNPKPWPKAWPGPNPLPSLGIVLPCLGLALGLILGQRHIFDIIK